MGSSESFKKDPNVFVYMELSKQIYTAGEMVEGNVYLDVQSHSTYDALYIRFQGKQYCYWSEGSGKNRRTYSNSKQTYLQQFIIHKFDGGVVALGQYVFPFSFVLPNAMSGSFFNSQSNFIKYSVVGSLNSFQKLHDNQTFSVDLTINESLKVPFGSISRSQSVSSKCCGCCANYGTTTVHLSCDRNFAMTGDQLAIKGRVDHTQGLQDIDNVTVNLVMCKIMVSSGGRTSYRGGETYPLLNFREKYGNKKVMKGQSEDIVFSTVVPTQIQSSTAIGSITAIWFEIQLVCDLGYCNYSPPHANLQILIHSRNPSIAPPPKVSPPQQWLPLTAQKVFYNSMKPFIYQPVAQIALINSSIAVPQGNMGENMGGNRGGNMGGNMIGLIPTFKQENTFQNLNNQDEKYGQNKYQEFQIL